MITASQFFLALLEGISGASVLALTALGLSLVFGVMRIINIAHGEFVMIGAVLAYAVASAVGGNPLLGFMAAVLIAPLAAGALAIAADFLILRRVNYDPERTIVATMGLLFIAQQVAQSHGGRISAESRDAITRFRVALPRQASTAQG